MKNLKINKPVNTGVIVEPLKMGAYIAGLESGIVYAENNPTGDYSKYLPTKEYQSDLILDTMGCVSFAGNNIAEMIFMMLIDQGKISDENVKWLKKNGYFDKDDKINFSDRFSAKVSGTTKLGNSMDNYWLSVYKIGLIPEKMWTWDRKSTFNWDQYYAEPTQECYKMAEEFNARFKCLYEVVLYFQHTKNPNQSEILKKYLKQSPLHIATFTPNDWNRKDGKPVKSNVCGWNHATALYRMSIDSIHYDFDHYDPCKKLLSPDYCINIVYSAVFSEKVVNPVPEAKEVPIHEFKTILKYKQRSPEIQLFQEALKTLGFFDAVPTGYYGNVTRDSVKKFQSFYKVASEKELALVDGKQVGLKTLAKVNKLISELKKNSEKDSVKISIDEAGLKLIKSFEGCILKPYKDVAGVWTIGWGNTYIDGKPVTSKTPKLTQKKADELLLQSIKSTYEVTVKKEITRELTQNEHNACVSFCYNLGSMQGLAKKINNKTVTKNDWLAYSHAKVDGVMKQLSGLLARRKKEADLYFKK